MRISDWSSDVCSSDLRSCLLVRIDETQHGGGRAGKAQLVGKHVTDQPRALPRCPALGKRAHGKMATIKRIGEAHPDLGVAAAVAAHLAEPPRSQPPAVVLALKLDVGRSEERRVGKECVSTGRSGWWRVK